MVNLTSSSTLLAVCRWIVTGLLTTTVLAGCSAPPLSQRHAGPISVVTTSTVLAAMARSVGGRYVTVESLIPIGASPESYEPTPASAMALHDARLLIENGHGYETWLARFLHSADTPNLRIVVASLGIEPIGKNPHLWMDPVRAQGYLRRIRDGLIAVDRVHAAAYREHAAHEIHMLTRLQHAITRAIAKIPRTRRTMLVVHDAWIAYNHRFGLKTLAVIEAAPGREPSAQRLAQIIRLARRHHVRTVFSEADESPRLALAVAAALPHGRVVPLYVDSLGPEGRLATYDGLLRYDTARIVMGLR